MSASGGVRRALPDEFQSLLSNLCKAILRNRPLNIYQFCANWAESELDRRIIAEHICLGGQGRVPDRYLLSETYVRVVPTEKAPSAEVPTAPAEKKPSPEVITADVTEDAVPVSVREPTLHTKEPLHEAVTQSVPVITLPKAKVKDQSASMSRITEIVGTEEIVPEIEPTEVTEPVEVTEPAEPTEVIEPTEVSEPTVTEPSPVPEAVPCVCEAEPCDVSPVPAVTMEEATELRGVTSGPTSPSLSVKSEAAILGEGVPGEKIQAHSDGAIVGDEEQSAGEFSQAGRGDTTAEQAGANVAEIDDAAYEIIEAEQAQEAVQTLAELPAGIVWSTEDAAVPVAAPAELEPAIEMEPVHAAEREAAEILVKEVVSNAEEALIRQRTDSPTFEVVTIPLVEVDVATPAAEVAETPVEDTLGTVDATDAGQRAPGEEEQTAPVGEDITEEPAMPAEDIPVPEEKDEIAPAAAAEVDVHEEKDQSAVVVEEKDESVPAAVAEADAVASEETPATDEPDAEQREVSTPAGETKVSQEAGVQAEVRVGTPVDTEGDVAPRAEEEGDIAPAEDVVTVDEAAAQVAPAVEVTEAKAVPEDKDIAAPAEDATATGPETEAPVSVVEEASATQAEEAVTAETVTEDVGASLEESSDLQVEVGDNVAPAEVMKEESVAVQDEDVAISAEEDTQTAQTPAPPAEETEPQKQEEASAEQTDQVQPDVADTAVESEPPVEASGDIPEGATDAPEPTEAPVIVMDAEDAASQEGAIDVTSDTGSGKMPDVPPSTPENDDATEVAPATEAVDGDSGVPTADVKDADATPQQADDVVETKTEEPATDVVDVNTEASTKPQEAQEDQDQTEATKEADAIQENQTKIVAEAAVADKPNTRPKRRPQRRM